MNWPCRQVLLQRADLGRRPKFDRYEVRAHRCGCGLVRADLPVQVRMKGTAAAGVVDRRGGRAIDAVAREARTGRIEAVQALPGGRVQRVADHDLGGYGAEQRNRHIGGCRRPALGRGAPILESPCGAEMHFLSAQEGAREGLEAGIVGEEGPAFQVTEKAAKDLVSGGAVDRQRIAAGHRVAEVARAQLAAGDRTQRRVDLDVGMLGARRKGTVQQRRQKAPGRSRRQPPGWPCADQRRLKRHKQVVSAIRRVDARCVAPPAVRPRAAPRCQARARPAPAPPTRNRSRSSRGSARCSTAATTAAPRW